MNDFLLIGGITLGSLLLFAGFIHLCTHLGKFGKLITNFLSQAPGLDMVIGYFGAAPLVVGPILGGWVGLGASICAQVLAVMIWTLLHGLMHPKARKGPRIVNYLNGLVGPVNNFVAVWITSLALPAFFLVRLAEIFVYPFLIWLLKFPKYKESDWVRVYRYQFKDLVGHDLIWCLYCDWMTGIWSLGTEMLRNVESFWCPIRFDSDEKNKNCAQDFPDIFGGWVKPDATMEEVVDTLKEQYGEAEIKAWFGHSSRKK
jgi:hypothetical protein